MTTTGAPASCIRRAAEAVSELLTDRLTGRPSAAPTTTGRPRHVTFQRPGPPASCTRRAAEAVSELPTDRLTGRPSAAATTTGRPRSSTSDRAGPPTTGLWSALANRGGVEGT